MKSRMKERLPRLKLPSLQYRRKRGDMIQTYKIMRGFDRIDPPVFFKFLPSQVTRGHIFKIHKQQAQCQVRSQSYSIRVVNDWNNLPTHVVNAKSVAAFKKRLDSDSIFRRTHLGYYAEGPAIFN